MSPAVVELSLALKTGRCTTIALYYYTRKWGLVDVAKALTCAPSSPMLHCTLESRWHIRHGGLYEISSRNYKSHRYVLQKCHFFGKKTYRDLLETQGGVK